MTTIAIVGAGYAGLSAAKVLRQAGHRVVLLERDAQVGGVWTASRRYPGLGSQNDKGTYAMTDHPMPESFPVFPTGAQVQEYLVSYATRFGLTSAIRLDTEVIGAQPTSDGWAVTTMSPRGTTSEEFGHLVVANGLFSHPRQADFPGLDDFEAAGGRVVSPFEVTDVEQGRGRDIVVVGYGKSACDVAEALSPVASSVTVLARKLLWKFPQTPAGLPVLRTAMFTRLGEALFGYVRPDPLERFLHGPGSLLRRWMLDGMQRASVRALGLAPLNLVPTGSFEDLARGEIALATTGFFDAVRAGTIEVRRERVIRRLFAEGGVPSVQLDDGTVLEADLVVLGTGSRQEVPFLPAAVVDRLCNEHGEFELYRHMLPLDVPNLSFTGYVVSFYSAVTYELSAVWLARYLAGELSLPSQAAQRDDVAAELAWTRERSGSGSDSGTNLVPFSMHVIDDLVGDLGLNLGWRKRLSQYFAPMDPADYAWVAAAALNDPKDD